MQQDVDQDQDQVAVIQVSPLERKDGGDWIVGMSIVGMRFKMNIGGSVVEFDSAKPTQGSPGVSYLEPLLRAKFTATIAANGDIRKLDGRDEILKTLKAAPGGSDALIKSMLSEASIKKMFAPIGEYLPDRAERVGAHWERRGYVELGPIGKYVYENRYTYLDRVGPVHENRAQTVMKYESPEKNAPGLPFAIKNVKTTKTDGKGSYKFDAERGRLKESTHEAVFQATLDIGIGNMDTTIELDQTQTTKVRVLDRNPLAK